MGKALNKNNNILTSITMKANGIDYQGSPVADASMSVNKLWLLPHDRALQIHTLLSALVRELHTEVAEVERLEQIAKLEEELKQLKTEEVK